MSNITSGEIGSVATLWRYPVKSMMGEELNVTYVTEHGLLGDRAYALLDESTGKIASAKNPRKWGQLLNYSAALVEPPRADATLPPVRIAFPDGTITSSEQDEIDELLSSAFKRRVILTTARPESPSVEKMDASASAETITDIGAFMMESRFSDYAAVHILTIATLDRLQELYPQGRFDLRRFRPNIVVEPASGKKGFIENAWVGHTLAIGDEVRLRITDPCPRCVMTTLPQGDLPKDLGILRTVTQYNQVSIPILKGEPLPSVGVEAFVLQGGIIRHGDLVWIE